MQGKDCTVEEKMWMKKPIIISFESWKGSKKNLKMKKKKVIFVFLNVGIVK